MPTAPRYRWFVVSVFFIFMLLHQADKLLIGPLTTPIMETFGIDEAEMGAVFTGALIVGALFYPLWGYLYDRFARSRLLAAASLIWGATTWLSAIAPTYRAFLVTRASTGIDDSSYPGLFSLICDYFEPRLRGKVYGILQLTQPLGYLIGMLLGLLLSGALGWRGIYYLTGSLGVGLSVVIFFSVREAPRGRCEPEMAGVEQQTAYKFDWKIAKALLRKRSLMLIFVQGFFGVFPWNVITYWFFRYLEKERNYSPNEVLVTMVVAVLVLASGYYVGGAAGDYLFRRTPRGRLIVCTVGVFVGAILLLITLNVPHQNRWLFGALLSATALFIPLSSPNIIATVYDVSLPEVRSTAYAIESFVESAGATVAPLLAGLIAVRSSLGNAILLICISTWALCTVFLAVAAYLVPADIATLRAQMRERADRERALQTERPAAG
jgi:MFS transporter, Spinster family, sphingosine-1-phosphate transporter